MADSRRVLPVLGIVDEGFDALCLEWGHEEISDRERLRQDAAVALHVGAAAGDYQQLMLVGKSLGTRAMAEIVTDDAAFAKAPTIWLTPLLKDDRIAAALQLLGLRRRGLQLQRVVNGRPAPTLNVRQQYSRAGDAGLMLRSLKTGDRAWRTVDLDEGTAAVLRAHLDAQEFQRRSWGPTYASKCPRCGKQLHERCSACGLLAGDLDLVFCHPDGSLFDPDVITHRFERRTKLCAGVIRIRFHDMRHTHATLLLEDGATERYVAERLGDTVEMIHETYGHVTPKMRIAAVERLAKRLRRPAVTVTATARDRT